jgi:hypothetical protein
MHRSDARTHARTHAQRLNAVDLNLWKGGVALDELPCNNTVVPHAKLSPTQQKLYLINPNDTHIHSQLAQALVASDLNDEKPCRSIHVMSSVVTTDVASQRDTPGHELNKQLSVLCRRIRCREKKDPMRAPVPVSPMRHNTYTSRYLSGECCPSSGRAPCAAAVAAIASGPKCSLAASLVGWRFISFPSFG